MKSLADYIRESLDKVICVTKEIERRLDVLFDLWDARDINIEDFRNRYGFSESDNVSMLLDFMTEYAEDPKYTGKTSDEETRKVGK